MVTDPLCIGIFVFLLGKFNSCQLRKMGAVSSLGRKKLAKRYLWTQQN